MEAFHMQWIKKPVSLILAVSMMTSTVLGSGVPTFGDAGTSGSPITTSDSPARTTATIQSVNIPVIPAVPAPPALAPTTAREKSEIIVKFRQQNQTSALSTSGVDNSITALKASVPTGAAPAPTGTHYSEDQIWSRVQGHLKLHKFNVHKFENHKRGVGLFRTQAENALSGGNQATDTAAGFRVIQIDPTDNADAVVQDLKTYSADIEYAQPNYKLSKMESPTSEDPLPAVIVPSVAQQEATANRAAQLSSDLKAAQAASENTTVGTSTDPAVNTTTESVAAPALLATPAAIPWLFDIKDPMLPLQWALNNTGQTVQASDGVSGMDISLQDAWAQTKGSADVLVGVLDTGIDTSHEDLQNNISPNGRNFIDSSSNVYSSPSEDTHGTEIAGIIAAEENGLGILGTAPKVKILPLKFMSGGEGYTSDAIEAITYAESQGVKIMNCSFGSTDYNYALADAMANSQMLFVCAAGNNSSNNDTTPVYPASFKLGNVLSVGAIDNTGNLASFSNYGTTVHVAAPGSNIITTVPGNQYDYCSGTSFATAYVSGIAALVESAKTNVTAKELQHHLATQFKADSALQGKIKSGGIVDAGKCVTADVLPVIDSEDPLDILNGTLGKVKHISELSKENLALLASLFDNDTQSLLALDSYNYTSDQLIQILLQVNRDKMSLKTASRIIAAINNPTKTAQRLLEYRTEILYKNIKLQSDDQIVEYVASTMDLKLVGKALTVANALSLQLEQVLAKPDVKLILVKDSAYAVLTEDYGVSCPFLIDYQKSSKLTYAQILDKVRKYEQSLNGKETASSAVFSDYGVNYSNYLNSPFKLSNSANESISPVTGELNLSMPLFQIQGKSGNIPLALQYNSEDSDLSRHLPEPAMMTHSIYTIVEGNVIETCDKNYGMIDIGYNYEYKDASGNVNNQYRIDDVRGPYNMIWPPTGKSDLAQMADNYSLIGLPANCTSMSFSSGQYCNYSDHEFSRKLDTAYNLGAGWGLSLPSMEQMPVLIPIGAKDDGTRYWNLRTPDGKKITVRQDFTSLSHTESLYFYNRQDQEYSVAIDNTYTNGEYTSHFVLTAQDGSKTYFSNSGYLLAMFDPFGNKTVFAHTVVPGSGLAYISKITDGYEHVTNLAYGADGSVTITQPGGLKTILGINNGLLSQITDQAGRSTKYSYMDPNASTGIFNYNLCRTMDSDGNISGDGSQSNTGTHQYNLITNVLYPTNASTTYTYTKSKRMNTATRHYVSSYKPIRYDLWRSACQ